ncbi:MAG: response regulator [Pseudomonadota bacterium]
MNFKLKQLLTLSSLLIVAICWIVASINIYFYTKSLILKSYKNHHVEKTKNLHSVLKNDIITGNYIKVKIQLELFVRQTNADIAIVFDKNEVILESATKDISLNISTFNNNFSNSNLNENEVIEYAFLKHKSENIFICSSPILFQGLKGDYFGKLYIVYNTKALNTQLINLIVFFASVVIIALICQFFIINLVANKIINSILSLIYSIKKSDNKGYLTPVKIDTDILELKELSIEYNKMVKKVREAHKTIKNITALAAIGQTTSMLAHDVRKPFTSMKSILSMIDKIKDNPSSLKKAKKTVNETIAHVESMISDILNFSREVKVEVNPEGASGLIDFSVRQAVQGHKNISVDFEYDLKNDLKPLVDDERMARVFVNIIGNGIEALKSHQPSAISIHLENSRSTTSYKPQATSLIWLKTRNFMKDEKEFVEIIIGNNGPKIAEEDLKNLFESFFTKGKKAGTGLGLASAHKIVTLHGGTIEARNVVENKRTRAQENKSARAPEHRCTSMTDTEYQTLNTEYKSGVEFVITIPASNEIDKHNLGILPKNTDEILFVEYEPLQEDTDEKLSFLLKQEKIKVVLLEDETLYRAFVRNTIESNEVLNKIITLYDADKVDECIDLVKKESIGFAIVDIDLNEEKNGYDFLKEIKDQKIKLNSIVHSNRYLDEEIQHAYDLGAKSYASKPFSTEQLVDFLYINLGGKVKESRRDNQDDQVPNDLAKKSKEGKKLICFVIDDNFITRENIAMMLKEPLEGYNYEIKKYESPFDAEKEFDEIKPDLVISDNHLGCDDEILGEDLLKKFRDKEDKVLLYLCSDAVEESLKEKAKKSKANGFFPPNVTKEEFNNIILSDLEKYLNKIKSADSITREEKKALSKYFHDINKPILNASIVFKLFINSKEEVSIEEKNKQLEALKNAYSTYSKVYENSSNLFVDYKNLIHVGIKDNYSKQFIFMKTLLELDLLEVFTEANLNSINEFSKMNREYGKEVRKALS